MNALELATALLKCPSVTPKDEGALGVLEALLTSAGFSCERMPFSDENTPTIDNIYARFGKEEPYLLFAGHTDVVPIGKESEWALPPFAGKVKDEELYGRGAVDMKGAIAAFAAAAVQFTKQPFQGSIGFLITGDEEDVAINGTVKMLAALHQRGERFTHCIVGEPTNVNQLGDMIKIGRRGSLSAIITVKGVQGHVAYPHLACNPLPTALKLADSFVTFPLDNGNAHFDKSNLELTSIDVGNLATNVTPESVVIKFNIRYNDEHTLEGLKTRILAQANRFNADKIEVKVEFGRGASSSFITKPNDFTALISNAIREVTGLTPQLSTTGGTSDARFIKDYCPVIEFGLVGQTMHKVNERVPLRDLEGLTKIYEAILEKYFKQH